MQKYSGWPTLQHGHWGTGLVFCTVYLWLGHSSLGHRSGKFQNRSKGSSWMTYNPKVAWVAHGSTRHSTDSSLGIMGGMVSWTSDCPTLSEYVVTVLACISVTLSYGRACLLTKIWFIKLLYDNLHLPPGGNSPIVLPDIEPLFLLVRSGVL